MRRFVSASVCCALLLLAGYAGAQSANPVAQVEKRQQEMKRLGGAMKTLQDYLKDGKGTPADVQKAADEIKAVAPTLPGLFPAGTAVGVGKSEALPAIWEKRAEFDKIAADLVPAAETFAAAAGSGDKAAIGGAMMGVGKNCQSCHEGFRVKKS